MRKPANRRMDGRLEEPEGSLKEYQGRQCTRIGESPTLLKANTDGETIGTIDFEEKDEEKMLQLLKTLSKEEETDSNWDQGGSWSGKGKGKGKGKKGGKGDNDFENLDGTVQKRCWNFDTDQECWRKDCTFAHVRTRTGVNENPPKKNADGGGRGAPPATAGHTAGGAGAAAGAGERRVIGRVVKKQEENVEKSEAAKVRETVQGALIDPEHLVDKGEGVEIAAMTTLTCAGELSEVIEDGESINTIVAIEKKSKDYVENIKGYISEDAKKNGTRIGQAGLKALHEGLLKLFKDQGMTKKPTTIIHEDEKAKRAAEAPDVFQGAMESLGEMLNKTLEKALSNQARARPVASPARKRRDTKATPKKKKDKLDELRKKLLMETDDEGESDEDTGPGTGTDRGTPTREEQIEATASLLLDTVAAVEKKMEEVGRIGDPVKKDYSDETPLKDLPMEWIFTGSVGSTPKELNMGNFDEVTIFVLDNFTKTNFEAAANTYIPQILNVVMQLKRGAEVACKAVETYGVKCKGPKRLKMTCILFGLMIAKGIEAN